MVADFFRKFVHRPQQVFLRKAMFQIHLWIGIFVAIYIVLIGLSGSILVFRDELTRMTREGKPHLPVSSAINIDMAQAADNVRAAYPQKKLTFMYAPRPEEPVYVVYALEKQVSTIYSVDPSNGKILGEKAIGKSLLSWIGQLHYFLLLGRSPGLILNGIGAALLLILTLTGLVLWWPGLKAWTRGFIVDFSKSWKRINFDSHNVIGFWTLAIVSFWAISGVYFTWPREVTATVNFFSPVSQRAERISVPPNKSGKWADLRLMANQAVTQTPGKLVGAVRFPTNDRAPFMLYMVPPGATTLTDSDYVYFEPASGKHIKTVQRTEKRTAGDWIIWAMHPLHFGTSWGLAVKILYFVLGLSLPLMAITGTLMYWNRYLGKKWQQLRQGKTTPAVSAPPRQETPSPATVHARQPLLK